MTIAAQIVTQTNNNIQNPRLNAGSGTLDLSFEGNCESPIGSGLGPAPGLGPKSFGRDVMVVIELLKVSSGVTLAIDAFV